jgi:hypothetical protein
MTHFLEGVIAGILVGGWLAFRAYSAVSARVAHLILEENDKCHP